MASLTRQLVRRVATQLSHNPTLPVHPPTTTFHTSILSHSTAAAASSASSSASRYSRPVTHHPYSEHLPSGIAVLSDFIVDHASGSYVYGRPASSPTTTKPRPYLDFTCGIGVTNLGHCHPRVDAAVLEQVKKGAHLQINCYTSQPILALADKFDTILPASFPRPYQVLFSNSGAEAIENAVKLARVVTKRQTIIVFQGGFHGRTIAAGSLTTAKYVYRAGFQPTMAGVHVAPFPYCQRCSISAASNGEYGYDNCCMDPIKQLRLMLKQQTATDEVAAILVEPVQGEGGYVVPPRGFMQELRSISDEIGCLLIADEVQSGYGRTGTPFAIEHDDVVPDIIVAAKGIANGYPLSCIITRSEYLSAARNGSIGGTYGGNAVSCAAAIAVIDTFEQDNIMANVQARGKQLMTGLRALQRTYPIADVRGRGLMIGVEFDSDAVAAGSAGVVSKECMKEGLLLLTAGVYESLRFIPPLTVSEKEIAEGLEKFEKVLKRTIGTKK